MKAHYFEIGGEAEAKADLMLQELCVRQGYVPKTCLLAGPIVWGVVQRGEDPCLGCEGPRERCHGRPKERVPS
jgi:hypothetical protein